MTRGRWIVVALVLIAAVGFAQYQPEHFTDIDGASVRPGVAGPPPPATGYIQQIGPTTFYTDRPTFQAANPGLTPEDYTGTLVPPNDVASCLGPFNSATNNACFAAGAIVPGISMEPSGDDSVVLTVGFLGMPCVGVGPNTFADDMSWVFSPAVDAFGVDLYEPLTVGATWTFEALGPGGSLGSTTFPGAGLTPTFFGVDTGDPGGITSVVVTNLSSDGEIFCDAEFGIAIPVEVTGFSVE